MEGTSISSCGLSAISITCTTTYRFGFNGMELDNEVSGEGNSIEYGGRSIYDSRTGRFSSIDPWTDKYPWQSTYAYYPSGLSL